MKHKKIDSKLILEQCKDKHQNINFIELGQAIHVARKRRLMSIVDLAKNAGIHRSSVYNIENGKNSVSAKVLLSAINELGLYHAMLKVLIDDVDGRKMYDLKVLVKQSIKEYKL